VVAVVVGLLASVVAVVVVLLASVVVAAVGLSASVVAVASVVAGAAAAGSLASGSMTSGGPIIGGPGEPAAHPGERAACARFHDLAAGLTEDAVVGLEAPRAESFRTRPP